MTKRKLKSNSKSTKEGNARAGYCATAFFANASDIPAVVAESLPDGKYCTLDDMQKAMKRVEKQLLALHPNPGRHYVMVQVKEARELALTLVLADTSVGFDDEPDNIPTIEANHSELKKTVAAVQKILRAAQTGSTSFEELWTELEKLPNPALTSTVLSYMDKNVPIVQSLAGPIDLSIGRLKVKEVASLRDHVLKGTVSGGYEEQANTVIIEITGLENADSRLFNIGHRIVVRVFQEEHRVNLLLAQLTKIHVQVTLKVPRIPITLNRSGNSLLRSDLVEVTVLEQHQSLENIKKVLIQQLNLEI